MHVLLASILLGYTAQRRSRMSVFFLSAQPPMVPHWLTHLGPMGLICVAVLDSSAVPLLLPGSTDLLLLWLVAYRADPLVPVASAVAGSLLGGYTTWRIGRSGGDLLLRSSISKPLRERIVVWVQRHPMLSIFLPALFPPPIPLAPFVLASGALGVSRNRFLMVFGSARCLRYSMIAWLGMAYGDYVVRILSTLINRWATPLIVIFAALVIAGIWYAVFRLRRVLKNEAIAIPG